MIFTALISSRETQICAAQANARINLKGYKWVLLRITAQKSAARTVNLARNLMVST